MVQHPPGRPLSLWYTCSMRCVFTRLRRQEEAMRDSGSPVAVATARATDPYNARTLSRKHASTQAESRRGFLSRLRETGEGHGSRGRPNEGLGAMSHGIRERQETPPVESCDGSAAQLPGTDTTLVPRKTFHTSMATARKSPREGPGGAHGADWTRGAATDTCPDASASPLGPAT